MSGTITMTGEEYDALHAEAEALWSTYSALVDKLGIDTEKAKTADGKPSDVIVSYVEALRAENAKLRAALAEQGERQEAVAWGAFHFGGKRNGKLYAHCETEEQIESYIADLHRSNDSITLRKGPLYTAPQPGPDVRALVEALEYFPEGASDGECFAVDAARTALAATALALKVK